LNTTVLDHQEGGTPRKWEAG